jgi:hypothetical protein
MKKTFFMVVTLFTLMGNCNNLFAADKKTAIPPDDTFFREFEARYPDAAKHLTVKQQPMGDETNQTSLFNSDFGRLLLLTIGVSLILTWGIGIGIPILIRYAIVRKPLRKKWAIGMTASLFVFNIALFSSLGSTSKSHLSLFIIAWLSYIILKREPKTRKATTINGGVNA